jgi:hypothetical protein
MQTLRNKRRLYYTGGLISLILLPILCISYFQYHKVLNKTHLMEVNWTSEERWREEFKDSSNPTSFFQQSDIEFLEIKLNGNDRENKIKLDNAQIEIRRIIATKDTTKGVHFYFETNSKYWTVIRAFDICNIEKAHTYVPFENHVWMFNYFPKPKPIDENQRPFCGNSAWADNYGPMKGGYKFEELIENTMNESNVIIKSIKEFWFVAVLLILLTVLSLRRLMSQDRLS